MVLADFLAALDLLVKSPERHFNVYTVWAVAAELGEERQRALEAAQPKALR